MLYFHSYLILQIGQGAFNEIIDLSRNCCPNRNNPKCPIRGLFCGNFHSNRFNTFCLLYVDSVLSQQRCFAIDSLVSLSNGKRIPIADLRSGDTVLAYDDHTKQIVPTNLLTMLDFQPNRYGRFFHTSINAY